MTHATGPALELFPVPPKPTSACTALLDNGSVCGSTRFWLKDARTRHARWICVIAEPIPLVPVCEVDQELELDETLHATLKDVKQEAAQKQAEFDSMKYS